MAPPFLPEEEDDYVESVINEGQNIYDQLIRRQEEIIGKKRELREIHKELIQMCYKLDVELLQVRTEDVFENTLLEVHTFDVPDMVYFFTLCD